MKAIEIRLVLHTGESSRGTTTVPWDFLKAMVRGETHPYELNELQLKALVYCNYLELEAENYKFLPRLYWQVGLPMPTAEPVAEPAAEQKLITAPSLIASRPLFV